MKRPFFAPLAFVLLAACAREQASWTAAEAPNRLQVDWRSESHVSAFAPAAAELPVDEKARLGRFLQAAIRTGDERITLSAAPDADRSITEKRMESLRRMVAAAAPGRPITVAPVADNRLQGNSALIVVGRYVVSTPNCPNWRKPSGIDAANQPSSNLGCANATNLGLMVADPADLVVGQDLQAADAEAMALSIRRYREGKVTPLPKDATTLTTGAK